MVFLSIHNSAESSQHKQKEEGFAFRKMTANIK